MIFFSSDDAFAKIYQAIKKTGEKVELLVSEPPKRSGRGQVVTRNAAHDFAARSGIEVICPESFESKQLEELGSYIKKMPSKIGFVFAYGKILTQDVIDLFEGNIFNLHPSLLPLYRGATPIQSALLDGIGETGYSIIRINSRLDAGDIIFQEKIKVDDNDDYNSLAGKIIDQFYKRLPDILKNIKSGKLNLAKQDESSATYTRKFEKTDGEIKKSDTAKSALMKVRAFSKWPKAYVMLNDIRVIIHQAHLEQNKLVIDTIQKESGKKMPFTDFAKGNQTLLTQMPDFVRMK